MRLFFGATSTLPALLPVVALQMRGTGPGTFPLLMAAMGSGAVTSMLFLQHLRARFSRDWMVLASTIVHAGVMVVVAMTRSSVAAGIAMFFAGASMLSASSSLNVAAQLCLPDRLRARGMATNQMALLGSGAIGSALWGQVATIANVPTSLTIAAATAVLGTGMAIRATPAGNTQE